MQLLASATLLQGRQGLRVCTIRLIALQPDAPADARAFVVSRSVTQLPATPPPADPASPADPAESTARPPAFASSESTLTPLPLTLEQARRKAEDFVRHRTAMGDVLQSLQGFDALGDLPISGSTTPLPPINDNFPADTTLTSNTERALPAQETAPPCDEVEPEPSAWPTPSLPEPPPGEAQAIARLVACLEPKQWRKLSEKERARRVWRVAERFDSARQSAPDQQRLYQLAPRLIKLIEQGDDLLDYCLAWALGRLADPGTVQALAALARHGRSAATRELAGFARLLILAKSPPEAIPQDLHTERTALLSQRQIVLQQLGELASRHPPSHWPPGQDGLPDNAARQSDARVLQLAQHIALFDPTVHAALCEVLRDVRLLPDVFPQLRRTYQQAELAGDWPVLACLHSRFEASNALWSREAADTYFRDPRSGELRRQRMRSGQWVKGVPMGTRDYFRTRGLRNVRRLAAIHHSQAAPAALALLQELDRHTPEPLAIGNRLDEATLGWTAATWLLLGRDPRVLRGPRRMQMRLGRHPDWLDTQLPSERTDAPAGLWDRHVPAALQLLQTSRNPLVHWAMVRVLQDHRDWLLTLPAGLVGTLLASRLQHTAELALQVVEHRLQHLNGNARLPWWLALARSQHPRAAEVLARSLGNDVAQLGAQPELIAALLLSPNASNRAMGYATSPAACLAQGGSPQATLNAVLAELAALDAQHPQASDVVNGLQQWLSGSWRTEAGQVPPAALLALLLDPELPVLQIATHWVLLHETAQAQLTAETLHTLLGAPEPERRACGIRLLAALPMPVLREQAELLFQTSQSSETVLREAVQPAFERLAAAAAEATSPHAPETACCIWLAERLHGSLFRTEPGEGVHTHSLALLTGPLAPWAPGQDPASLWRALQAQSTGAQRYGAARLGTLGDTDFSLRQWAVLGQHADHRVRARTMASIDRLLTPMADTSATQADALLPLAESEFEDVQHWSRTLFGQRLPEAALPMALLIRWVDHPKQWVQALGQQRLMRQMSAPEASLCLSQLAQHPSPEVQQFVTLWLLALPDEPAPQRAARLAALRPYFLTVLSQVHRGRVSKTRVQAFLREQIEAPETAAVVADICARQVVGAGRLDQPRYMALLRDIGARHPDIELPFMQWQTPEHRAPRQTAGATTQAHPKA